MLCKPKPNPTKTDEAQLERWNKFLIGWKWASKSKFCVLVGDTNLDFLKWQNPDRKHEKMVQRTKDVIEEAGHTQIIKGKTRSWQGQNDSLIDHCWLDKPQRVISHQNDERGSSDHNHISIILRTKDRCFTAPEMKKRSWNFFSPDVFKNKISEIDWNPIFETNDLDIKNSYFEEKVGLTHEEVAPMKYIQMRKNHRNWVDNELKFLMEDRDQTR